MKTTNKQTMNLQFFAWGDVDKPSGNKTDVEYLKLASGQMTKIRILDIEPFSRWTHWLPSQKRSLTCASGDCPICAVIKSQKENDETPTYNSQRKHILHVWNYETGKVEFFEQGNNAFKDLSAFHKMLGDIRSADIKVMKSGDGKDTKYTFLPEGQTIVAQHIMDAYNEKKVDFVERYKAPLKEDVLKLMAGASFEDVYSKKEEQASNSDEISFTIAQ